jgi:hypothetical protein
MKKKYKKNINTRIIKPQASYSVVTLSETLKVNKQTIYIWKKQGLKTIDNNLPLMFFGQLVIGFLENRKEARKAPCKIDEFYCLKCKKPKKAYDNKIALNPNGKNKVNVIAKCITCRTKTYKSQNTENIAEILKYYQVVEAP